MARRNTATFGNEAEVIYAKFLETQGWTVGSRRHIGGAGDLLAVRYHAEQDDWEPDGHEVHLIEVKRTTRPETVWQGFRRSDRLALIEAAHELRAAPLLAHLCQGVWTLRGPEEWPRL